MRETEMEAYETILEAIRGYERTHERYMSVRDLYSHGSVPESKYRVAQDEHREAAEYFRRTLTSYEEYLRESPGYVFMAVHRWVLACGDAILVGEDDPVATAWTAVEASLPRGE